jgi:hypothetical protein
VHFCGDEFWSLWALFGAVIYKEPSVFAFLVKCSPDGWRPLFALIRRVCAARGNDPEDFQAKFLRALTELIGTGEVIPTDEFLD